MKRKDVDETSSSYTDFSDISLSPPSTKLRRLDGDIYMNVEAEEKARASLLYEQGLFPIEEPLTSTSIVQTETPVVNPLPSNLDDRAIVLYDPANSPFLKSPSSSEFSIILNSDLVAGLKNLVFWPGNLNPAKTVEDEATTAEKDVVTNNCFAVVPWVASQLPLASGVEAPVTGQSEPMEAEGEAEMMDTEDSTIAESGRQAFAFGGMIGGGEGLQHWQQQQQQFLMPHLLQNASTPFTWQQIGRGPFRRAHSSAARPLPLLVPCSLVLPYPCYVCTSCSRLLRTNI